MDFADFADDKHDAEIEALQDRIHDRVERCIRALLIAMGRDHLRCGKAACLRSRRCRGFACEPDVSDEDEDV
jgi:hypothetical protein